MTAPRVTTRPTHNLTLSDGSSTLGLTLTGPNGMPDPRAIRQTPMPKTALQTTQGDPDYAALQLPYVEMTQKDWSGGRGWAKFQKDPTRFYDGYRVDTSGGDIILAPTGNAQTGYSGASQSAPPAVDEVGIMAAYASKFTATFQNVDTVEVLISNVGGVPITVRIYADGATPGALIATGSAAPESGIYESTIPNGPMLYRFRVPIKATLAIGTTYWISIDPWNAGVAFGPLVGKDVYQNGGGGWILYVAGHSVYYKILESNPDKVFFFEYKSTLYAVLSFETGQAPKIYRNGYCGTAAVNTTKKDELIVGTGPADVSGLEGHFVKITGGPGYTEEDNWRKITNSDSNEIWVAPSWNIAHDATTTWAVLGQDTWTLVTGAHGLTKVTGVLVVDDIIYFAQGDSLPIRRMRITTLGAVDTPANEANLDGTYQGASYLALIPDTAGTRRIWAAQANTAKVYNAPVVTWNNPLAWVGGATPTAIICGNPNTKITNCLPYGNPQAPFILKEEGIGSISWNPVSSTGVYAQIPLTELATVKDYRTGRTACQYGVYLFFNFLDGMERFYDNRLDDVGMNRDEGLPADRQGSVSALVPYPGGIIAGYDAGPEGYSAVYFWNQLGWNELYRAPLGKRIKALYLQTMPGTACDRLWIGEGNDIAFIWMAINPRKQADYAYCDTGYIITPWYTTNFAEIEKFWRSMTFYTENLGHYNSIECALYPYYQVDNAGDLSNWTAMPVVMTSPVQEVAIKADYTLTGKRIRFKIEMTRPALETITPRIIAWTISSVVRIPPANSWSITVLTASYQQNQQGRWEAANETTTLAKLKQWASSKTRAAPLIMRSEDPAWDNKMVFIDPTSIMPISLTTEANGGKRTVKALTFSLVENEPV